MKSNAVSFALPFTLLFSALIGMFHNYRSKMFFQLFASLKELISERKGFGFGYYFSGTFISVLAFLDMICFDF